MPFSPSIDSLFVTTLYFSGTESNITDTEQFSPLLDLTVVKGMTINNVFREATSGDPGTDEFLIRLYRSALNTRDGTELLIDEYACGYGSTSANKIKNIILTQETVGKAFCWLGFVSEGGDNEFGLNAYKFNWN